MKLFLFITISCLIIVHSVDAYVYSPGSDPSVTISNDLSSTGMQKMQSTLTASASLSDQFEAPFKTIGSEIENASNVVAQDASALGQEIKDGANQAASAFDTEVNSSTSNQTPQLGAAVIASTSRATTLNSSSGINNRSSTGGIINKSSTGINTTNGNNKSSTGVNTSSIGFKSSTGTRIVTSNNNVSSTGIQTRSNRPNANTISSSTGAIRSNQNRNNSTRSKPTTLSISNIPSSAALLFDICDKSDGSPEDKATVNWYAKTNRTSTMNYVLCHAPSLQPKLVNSFIVKISANRYGAKDLDEIVSICGPNSANQLPCANRLSSPDGCLVGTVTANFPYDKHATIATLTLTTSPPATSQTQLCL